MAVDVTLKTVASGYNTNTINQNFEAIASALEDAVSRSGATPNSMSADLDLNGHKILNIGTLDFGDEVSAPTVTTNVITERTPNSGVSIESVLVKDGLVDGRDVSNDGDKLDDIESRSLLVPSGQTGGTIYMPSEADHLLLTDGSGNLVDGGPIDALRSTGINAKAYGAVGDGATNDALALQAALDAAAGRTLFIPEGVYFVDSTTLNVTHPTQIEGEGAGVSIILFADMGGFAGKDGFNVNVSLSSELASVTSFRNLSVLSTGGFGRSGIKTPTNPSGGGDTLYNTVRPQFVFEGMTVGSRDRTFAVSSNMFGVDGWKNCIEAGESSGSVFRSIQFIQPFVPNIPQASWAGREECAGIYLNAGDADAGAGPVYHPLVEHITAHGCGQVIKTTGKVVSPKFTNLEVFGSGWGLHSSGPLFSAVSGKLNGLGEAVITDSNFNGIFGGIRIEGTDFLHIDGVRCSWPNIPDIDYAGNWCGLKIEAGFRQVDVQGFRAASFSLTAPATFRVADLNGRSPYYPDELPGQVNMSDVYISTGAVTWENEAIALRNVREAFIDPPKVRGSTFPKLFYHTSDHTEVEPKISLTGVLPYTFDGLVTHGAGSANQQFYTAEYQNALKIYPTASANGSQSISPRNARQSRQAFNAGPAPYTYDYDVSNVGAVVGQKIEFFLSVTASTNPTVRIRDENNVVRATITGTATATDWWVVGTWLDVGGVPSFRTQFIGKSGG
jgi:hypothetical protein